MDLEAQNGGTNPPQSTNNNDANEVVEEMDVFLKVPKKDLYMVQYPMRPYQMGFSEFEQVQGMSVKPL